MNAEPGDDPPKTTLDRLTEQEQAVWSHLHGPGQSPRRGRLEPLTAKEQVEFAEFAETLRRAKQAGFRAHHLTLDARHRRDQDSSALVMVREQAGQPTEVIVIWSALWAQAFRAAPGAPVTDMPEMGEAELEEEPGRLLQLVLAGAWPEEEGA